MACLQDQSTPETDAERSASPMTSKNNHHESDKPNASAEDILALQDLDPGMDKKMHLVNNVSVPPNKSHSLKVVTVCSRIRPQQDPRRDRMDKLPLETLLPQRLRVRHAPSTPKLKSPILTARSFSVDALQLSLQGIISVQAVLEFQPSYPKGLTIALYTGMLVGALFWGLFADIIGRKTAFNTSLLICSVFTVAAGAAPTWASLGFFIAAAAFGAGGNLILDTAVFLEHLPSSKQWTVSWLSAWWGVGCTIAGLVAWGYMPAFSCAAASDCARGDNRGWRYLMYTMGGLILLLSALRVTVIRLRETPKFLLGQGKDAEVVRVLGELAARYGRPCSLGVEQLEACGAVGFAHARSRFSAGETTVLLWLSWAIIGLAYPLFNVFLPYYLASRGVQFGVAGTYQTWRNYALVQVCGIPGPVLGGHMANCRVLGRRYTMVVGAVATMAFFFAYSQVASQEASVAYSCVISFTLEIYYGVLYGYTAETLPSAHRATGNGIAVAFCRLTGAMSAVVATYANPATVAPVFICAALYGGLAVCAFLLPFEPYGKRAS
ncbi:putative MFS transporter [Metarhizium anisopliae]|nr:putative MFS transporter [Metarhizium anisopliae]